MVFCCFRSAKTIESNYDPRFGAPDISSPNEGAFNSPHLSPGAVVSIPVPQQQPPKYEPGQFDDLEKSDTRSPTSRPLSYESQVSKTSSKSHPSPQLNKFLLNRTFPLSSPMPVHAAYIPDCRESVSNMTTGSVSSYTVTPTTARTPMTGGSLSTWPTLSPGSPPVSAKTGAPGPRGGLGLEHTMASAQPRSRPLIQLDPAPKRGAKRLDMSPESTRSLEEWPGRY